MWPGAPAVSPLQTPAAPGTPCPIPRARPPPSASLCVCLSFLDQASLLPLSSWPAPPPSAWLSRQSRLAPPPPGPPSLFVPFPSALTPSLRLCLRRTNGSPSPPPPPPQEPPPQISQHPPAHGRQVGGTCSSPLPSPPGHTHSFICLFILLSLLPAEAPPPQQPSGTVGSGVGVRGLAPGGGWGQATLTHSEDILHAWPCHLTSLSHF